MKGNKWKGMEWKGKAFHSIKNHFMAWNGK
jgi:hypothetical protein